MRRLFLAPLVLLLIYFTDGFRVGFYSNLLRPLPMYAFPAFKGSKVEINFDSKTVNTVGCVLVSVRDYTQLKDKGHNMNFYKNWSYCENKTCADGPGAALIDHHDSFMFQSQVLEIKGSGTVEFIVPRDNFYFVIVEPFFSRMVSGEFHIYSTGGELSAINTPLLNFHFIMSGLYAALLCAWIVMCYNYKSSIISVQYSIGVILSMANLSEVLRWLFLMDYNKNLTTSYSILLLLPLFTAAIYSFILFTTLLISKGQGIIVKHIKKVSLKRATILTVVTFISMSVAYYFDILTFSSFSVIYYLLSTMLHLPQIGYGVWILLSLRSSIQRLEEERQEVKLHKYYQMIRFFIFFFSTIWVSSLINTYFDCFKFNNELWVINNWRTIFIRKCWPYVMKFGFCCVYAWMWRPNGNNMLYSIEQINSCEDFVIGRPTALFELDEPTDIYSAEKDNTQVQPE